MLRAAITATRSAPMTLPLERISRILPSGNGRRFPGGALVVRAIDAVFLVENLHGEGIRLAHVSCSKAFRRKIIASTLCLAISFFSIR